MSWGQHTASGAVGPWSDADDAVRRCRAMAGRVLASWACDALRLRARGLDRPVGLSAGGGVRSLRIGPVNGRSDRRAA